MNRTFLAAGVLLTLHLTGCGGADVPEVGEVTGTVTIDGKPAPGVIVNFIPTGGGRSSTGVTDESGHYELMYSADAMGALIGAHQATIAAAPPSVDAVPAGRGPLVDKSIPKEYLDAKKPVEVQAGDNTIDLTYP